METIKGYHIHTSNASSKQKGSLTVKRGGVLLAKVTAEGRSSMLNYVRLNAMAPERLELVQQLKRSEVPDDAIEAILAPKPKVDARNSFTIKLTNLELDTLKIAIEAGRATLLEEKLYKAVQKQK